ncbi:ketopantoate reductase family protein [Nocardia aurantiaca]|uniref:Ketopantoate reductase C-terminal domain-containing protein n=1 Tax=Nocardia aurantiaca TaxID=2675850 RepID=A0A6I3KYE6_9NOCA|nr:ketopantoate reductase C-terminal domain-containing protein [Nocardia aurantiaca]MTE13570.1 hypothetical protein [Nocardia aurantiaca]
MASRTGSRIDWGEIRAGTVAETGAVFAATATDAAGLGEAVAKTLTEDLRDANFRAEQVADISAYKATKLVYSVTNALEVLAGDRADKARAGSALIAEARAVLTAAGIPFHPLTALTAEAGPVGDYRPVDARQSTWQSFARGAASNEIDYLNGEIAVVAREHGIRAPLDMAVQRLLRLAARRGGGLELAGLDTVLALLPASPAPGPSDQKFRSFSMVEFDRSN